MKRLYDVAKPDGVRVFCGPAAMMALTGKTYQQAQRSINRARGCKDKTRITGIYEEELVIALEKAGLDLQKTKSWSQQTRPTLAKWLDARGATRYNTYLIVMSSHFAVVQGNRYIDNHTEKPVPCDNSPFRKAKVRSIWHIK